MISLVMMAPMLGCMAAHPGFRNPPQVATSPRQTLQPVHKIKRAHRQKPVPEIALIGLSQAKAQLILGAPDEHATAGASQVWTYRARLCTLSLTFFLDVTHNDYDALSREISGTDGSEKQAQRCIRQIMSHAKPS